MRKLLSILRTRLLFTGLLLAVAFLAMPVTAQAAGFSGSGSGTAGDPYVITTPEQLNEVRNNLSAHYRLGADIDLSGYMNWEPIGSNATNSVAGGLVGYNLGSVARCYAAGGVRGPNLSGGLVGYNNCSISDSFWNSDSITDGAGEDANGTFAAAGKTTAEMKAQAAFAGWDFSGTWAITEGATYPCLAWQTAFTDFAPPAFAAGYPAYDQATAQGFRLKFTLDQDAVVYYAIQDDGAAFGASNSETHDIWADTYVDIHSDIRGGQRADRMPNIVPTLPSNRYGSVSVTAGTEATVTITGLAANTPYDVYLLAEDGAGNYSPALIKLDAATVLSSANDITGFTVAGQVGTSTIDTAGHTVTFHMPYGTDVTALTPTITVSADATIDPASGTAQDFTGPVSYTVTAQDGTQQVWTVTCVVDPALSGENDITGFTVAGQVGTSTIDTAGHTVTFHMPYGTDVTVLTPTITVSADATIDPASGTAQDFTGPVSYTVTAQDGTQQVWTVTCVVDPAGDLSGFDVQLAVPGDKTAGAAFDLSITNAKGTDGSALSGDINVTVTSSVYGEVHNAPITFTAGTAAVPVILTTEGDHVLTVNVTGVTNLETVNVTVAAAVTTGSISTGTPATPTYKAEVSGISTTKSTLPVNVDTDAGNAATDLGTLAKDIFNGTGTAVLTVPSVPDVSSYTVGIPASSLSGSQGEGALTFSTGAGSITIPSGMLAGIPGTEEKTAGITIAQGDKSGLPEEVKTAVGDRPIVQLTLTLDGKQAAWNNPSAPVTVSIPYTPTAAELADPEHIVVWYIDGSGNVVSVPNGRYDPATGTVTFTTTHFSYYAVSYVRKTFSDLGSVEWARKPVEVMASRGIITGTGADSFSPAANITRADYLVLLVRTLGLTAEFDDVEPGAYYYEAAGIAKKLGIAAGSGNNRFNPGENISRQDMMALTARALEKCKGLKAAGGSAVLDKFSDKGDVAEYAVNSLSAMVKEGLIAGSGDRLNPRANATRAEAAVFLYRICNKY